MDAIATILWPLRWIVELLLVGWHLVLSNFGLHPDAAVTWLLSIVGLVLVVRAALLPLGVWQIKGKRRMLEVAPLVTRIQDRYKDRKDEVARSAASREIIDLYERTEWNPLGYFLPLALQLPIFFALFSVLYNAQYGEVGVGPLNKDLAYQLGNAKLFGSAPLHDSFASQWTQMVAGHPFDTSVMWIATAMVVLMVVSHLITQLQSAPKNPSADARASFVFRQQRILLYLLPVVFVFSGVVFSLAVMFFWLTWIVWTMVQQFLVLRKLPRPGSGAAESG
jgi:YidC/Oxa1 family membrane protein insertase